MGYSQLSLSSQLVKTVVKVGVWLGLVLVFGLGLDYGLGFSLDIRLRQDPQLRVSHLAATQ